MAGSKIFQSYKRADAELREPGYTKAYINLPDDFNILSEPAPLDQNSVTGDSKIITASHVWNTGKKPMAIYIDNKSLEAPAELIGDSGSRKFKWTLKFFMKGDGPVAQDLAESFLNEDIIAFASDECPEKETLQFGCDCNPGEVVKGSFTSGTLVSGAKGYSFEVEFLCRFFYRGSTITTRA